MKKLFLILFVIQSLFLNFSIASGDEISKEELYLICQASFLTGVLHTLNSVKNIEDLSNEKFMEGLNEEINKNFNKIIESKKLFIETK